MSKVKVTVLFNAKTVFAQYLEKFICDSYYTPEVKLRTYYGMASVRPSVCPSVFTRDSHGTW